MRQTPSRPRRPRGRNQRTGSAQPRPRRRRGRDLRHGHQHTQGAASRQEDGRLQALQGPGERHRPELGRGHRGAVREAPRRLPGALRLARRDLRQVSPRGARRLHRRGHRHRMRRGRLEARPRRRRGGHRVLRLVAHLPADYPSARTRAAAVLEEAEPDALAYLDFPPAHWKRLRTNNVQERTNREIKRRSRVEQVFPSTGSLVRLAGAVMCEQDEVWQESRYFSEARMNELYDEGCRRGIDGPVDWKRLEAKARKMIESGLELADRIEAA